MNRASSRKRREVAKQEQQGGQVMRWGYAYDAAGRLVEERKILPDGSVLVTQWAYDANGNRVQEMRANGEVIAASSDDQDRLLSSGDPTFTHTHHGELFSKCQGTACQQFTYDVFGNLRQVVLDNGQVIEYLVDGRNRRIGKKIDGVLVQGWLYDDQLRVLAELDGQGNVVARFVYADGINVPELVEKGGRTYRLIKDQLGSVRLVVDVEDGTIIQEMRYDAWGNVVFDSNLGFQPFGFAGGLYDPQTRLVRFGARDYDASVGRWTAKDPVVFGDLRTTGVGSAFTYAAASPAWWSDVYGLFVIDEGTCGLTFQPWVERACRSLTDNPQCQSVLRRHGKWGCMRQACDPTWPCPRISCDSCGGRCGQQTPCEVCINLRCSKEGRPPTIFHEFLHECEYFEPYVPPDRPSWYDPKAEESCLACTGSPTC